MQYDFPLAKLLNQTELSKCPMTAMESSVCYSCRNLFFLSVISVISVYSLLLEPQNLVTSGIE